uniref:CBS domain-containing protein n=2 Tax=Chrysotila carterae TaxID=13221 RepID=A0A7S4F2N7_CHRCT
MARVAEELMDLGGFDCVLLGVAHETGKGSQFLSLIGRCGPRALTVDLASVMRKWDGGGHPSAAAASIRLESDEKCSPDGCASALSAMDEAMEALLAQVPEQVTASDIMTKSVVALGPDETMEDAWRQMINTHLKGMPVVDEGGKLIGALKYKDVVKAAQAGKAAQRVKAWMRRQVPTIPPDMPFHELEEFLISRSIGRLPVVDDEGKLLGIITRTDVLRQHNLYTST